MSNISECQILLFYCPFGQKFFVVHKQRLSIESSENSLLIVKLTRN